MISSEPHNKHADSVRAIVGEFHRNELAVLGTTCDEILAFVELIRTLFPEKNIAYADETHSNKDVDSTLDHSYWHKNHLRTELSSLNTDNRFQRIFSLSHADCVLINGNHFQASRQIIICNPEKENSLRKRKGLLTEVIAVVLNETQTEIPTYVLEMVGSKPILYSNDLQKLKSFLSEIVFNSPPINGLIMAGGKSTRMGQDKPWINFHGSPQVLFLSEMMKKNGVESWISCREEQRKDFESLGLQTIPDRISNFGPLGGIASAFMANPNSAWLVVASDIPLFDETLLKELIAARKTEACGTSFVSPFDRLAEPLAAIWEPRIFQQIMQFISLGYSCPRKVLMNTSTHLFESATSEKLLNVNTPEELDDMRNTHLKS